MTLEKASKIIEIYGIHLEYCSKLIYVFSSSIPESFLPFPKGIIEEAANVLAEHHFKNGNKIAVNSIENAKAALISYIDDEKAITESIKLWNDPTWRQSILLAFKDFQKNWIKTKNIDLE